MPLKRILFGPDWRSRDPERRARAVAQSADPELERELPRIAREDAEERVRLAALKRLDDPRRYLEAARSDPSPELRREAHSLAMRQLAGERPCALSETQLALLAGELLDPAESESLIKRARSVEVRRALLGRIHRLSVLVETSLGDPDPELRRMALERIEDPGALERVARRARGKDKRIERLAEERLAALRTHSAADLVSSAEALCREADAALRDPPSDPRAVLERLREARARLALPETDPRMMRLSHALAILEGFSKRREAASEPESPAAPEAEAAPLASPEAEAESEPPSTVSQGPEPDTASVPKEDALEAVGASDTPEPPPLPERDPEPRALLEALAEALEAGEIARAEQLAATLRGLSLAGRASERLKALSRKLGELRRWKSWTLREHRERLLQEMAALGGAGLHPDALAQRVRELRVQWEQLHREMPAPPALEGRFHALARAVLAPARAFFRRRDELRARRRREIEALFAGAEATLDSSRAEDGAPGRQTAVALAALRRRLAAAGRELRDLAAQDRARLGERLRRLLAALDERRRLHAEKTLQAKRALLERLEQSAGLPPERALRDLERVESEWRRLGRALPAQEAELRERFAALALGIREAHRESQLSAQRAEAERSAQAEALLRRIEALAEPSLGEIERLAQAFRSLRPLPAELHRALAEAIEEARRRAQAANRRRVATELRALLTPSAGAGDLQGDAIAGARRCCVALEELAGIPPRPEDAELRLRLQMERLAARLGQGQDDDLAAARAWLGDWQRLAHALPDPEPYAARLERAIEALAARLHPDPPRREAAAGDPPS